MSATPSDVAAPAATPLTLLPIADDGDAPPSCCGGSCSLG
ncbi:hypothetical protein QE381_000279 [Microbacterium sp. SORGH_AS 888]|nr:hypothetical protein [Microbacterium sp. SORGH_AS_0888]